jgi:group I intron endonuclease
MNLLSKLNYNLYFNGKIYIIRNSVNNIIYIGSSILDLELRFSEHVAHSKVMNSLLYKAMRNIGVDKFSIHLLKDFRCLNKDELERFETTMINQAIADKKILYNKNQPRSLISNAVGKAATREWQKNNKTKHNCYCCKFQTSRLNDLSRHLRSAKHCSKIGNYNLEIVIKELFDMEF